MTEITLVSNGTVWEGWKSFTVSQSMDSVLHAFDLTTTNRFQDGLDRWDVEGGSPVEIYFRESLAFKGFATTYSTSIDANTHTVSVSGNSLAIDIVECSHVGKYAWKNTQPEDVIREILKPFGLEVKISKPMKTIPKEGFRVAPNENAFGIIKKLADRDGLLVFTSPEGVISLSDGSDATGRSLIQTGDFSTLTITNNVSRAHSSITSKYQQNAFKKDFKKNQAKEVTKTNSNVQRYRPLIIIGTGDADDQQVFIDYANRRFAGDTAFATVTLKSAFDKQGNLWGINQNVWLRDRVANVDQEMIVSEVNFNFSDSGFITTLGLRVPETYKLENEGGIIVRRRARRAEGLFGDISKGLA